MRAQTVTGRATGCVRLLALAVVVVLATAGCLIMPGDTYTGDGTYYSGDGSGNCSYPASSDTRYVALNHVQYQGSFNCGAWLEVTGPEGTVTVKVVDQCPECLDGDLDLSPQAFAQIADPVDGRVPISWQLVGPPADVPATISIEVKDGSNPWWIGFQVRNHATIVSKVEAEVGSSWQALTRTSYNYFLAESGLGSGSFTLRLTDLYGQVVQVSGITLSPGVDQPTAVQFPH